MKASLLALIPALAAACSSSGPPRNSCDNVPADALVKVWTADPHYCLVRFASAVTGARQLARAENGDLFVASNGGLVSVLFDDDGDGVSAMTERSTFATLTGGNHGVAVTKTHVYASSPTTVVRWRYTYGDRVGMGMPETVVHDMPGGGHDTRQLVVDGSDRLYVNIGSGSNVDQPATPDAPPAVRALIRRYDLGAVPAGGYAAGAGTLVAAGLRNESGLAFDAQGRLWGVENGRDDLADDAGGDIHLDNPAEEVNLFDLSKLGRNYGYPFCWTEGVLAGTLSKGRGAQHFDRTQPSAFTEAKCQDAGLVVPPRFSMRAHLAPLGIVEVRGGAYPVALAGNLFVASHGSWNHVAGGQVGRMIVRLRPGGGGPVEGESFLGEDDGTGKLKEGTWTIRPVSIVLDEAGLMTFSDDQSGTVHKIGYRP